MSEGIKQIVYPVTDLAKAKTLYSELLGVEPYADAPFYVGFRVGDQELGLDPRGHGKGMTGPVGYWNVHDIRSALKGAPGRWRGSPSRGQRRWQGPADRRCQGRRRQRHRPHPGTPTLTAEETLGRSGFRRRHNRGFLPRPANTVGDQPVSAAATHEANRSYRDVLRNRHVAGLLLGDLLANVGTGMIIVAMPVQTLSIHGNVPKAIAIGLVEAAPFVLSTILALSIGLGRVRVPPRTLLITDCVLRSLTLATLGVLAVTDQLTLQVLIIGLLFGASFRMTGRAAGVCWPRRWRARRTGSPSTAC